MSTPGSLFLAPADSHASPDLHAVEAALRELAIIAGPLPGRSTYAAGDGFSRHVIYAGCSPHLVMQPPPDGSRRFCHVAFHGPFDQPLLVTGPNTVKPRCPACRARFDDWREQLAAWRAPGALAVCARCGQASTPHALDWRENAIGARVLVELRNVFPGEAAPSDGLMARLADASGAPWRYAWAAMLD